MQETKKGIEWSRFTGKKTFVKNSHASPLLNDTLTNLSDNPTGARKKETSELAQGDGKKR
jgi:hypothetical protein